MFAGYTHVDAFDTEAEYEDGEEVVYVTLDLGSNVNKELIPHTSEYRLVGLDADTPLLQLGSTIFRGVHEELIGTELLFTDGRDETNLSRKFVVPVATTEKRIKFEQVNVREKTRQEEAREQEDTFRGLRVGSSVKERGKGKGKEKGTGRAKETSKKGKGKAVAGVGSGEEESAMGPGEMILDLDTPLSGIL